MWYYQRKFRLDFIINIMFVLSIYVVNCYHFVLYHSLYHLFNSPIQIRSWHFDECLCALIYTIINLQHFTKDNINNRKSPCLKNCVCIAKFLYFMNFVLFLVINKRFKCFITLNVFYLAIKSYLEHMFLYCSYHS